MCSMCQNHNLAGEMVYLLGAFTALAEDAGSVPWTHMMAYDHFKFQFQGL